MMPKATLIGAGSVVFTGRLRSDILSTPALQESLIALMDRECGSRVKAAAPCSD
jgi:alpha-galactosidase/6-phospho-beta-glucosidase family protein